MKIVDIHNLSCHTSSVHSWADWFIYPSPHKWLPIVFVPDKIIYTRCGCDHYTHRANHELRMHDMVFYVFGIDVVRQGVYATYWKPPFSQILALSVIFWDRLVSTGHWLIRLLWIWGLADVEIGAIPSWRDIKIVKAIKGFVVRTTK